MCESCVPLPVKLVRMSGFLLEELNKSLYPYTTKQHLIAIIAPTAIFSGICCFASRRASFTQKCFSRILFPTITACLAVIAITLKRFHFYKILNSNKEAILKEVEKNGLILKRAPAFSADHEVVLEAIKQNGLALEHVDITLRNDKEIVREAFINNKDSLQYANSSLRCDPDFILTLTKIDKSAFLYAGDELWNNEKFLLGIIEINSFMVSNNIRFWKAQPGAVVLSTEVLFALLEKNPKLISVRVVQSSLTNLDLLVKLVTNESFLNSYPDPYSVLEKIIPKTIIEELKISVQTQTKSSRTVTPTTE